MGKPMALTLGLFFALAVNAQPPQPTLHFKLIQHGPDGPIILAETKQVTYSLICEHKNDTKVREVCGNFRVGQDYTPIYRLPSAFVFDDPEGSKDKDGNRFAVVVRIISEQEK